MMTEAVRLEHAAYLFYIAAKAGNSNVECAEIQEAVILEGGLERGDNMSYPVLFGSLVEFAVIGVVDDIKKIISLRVHAKKTNKEISYRKLNPEMYRVWRTR